MNPYVRAGLGVGTNEAAALAVRLTAWHDAAVTHERRLRTGYPGEGCDDECPHAEAGVLWPEAAATFGARAGELTFLRSRSGQTQWHESGGTDVAAPFAGVRQ
jgi:hypothetical protein